MMRKTSMMLAVGVLMLAASAAANEAYLDPPTVYIPECGTATVQVRMDVTDTIDTWSTKIGFDNDSVNITDVDFTGGITPTNASWGHHGDYIYLGGTELDNKTGDQLLANLTVECIGEGGCTSGLNITGEESVERLIAGPPDKESPRNGTIHAADWYGGDAQCVDCGDANGDGFVTTADVYPVFARTFCNEWVADVNGDGFVTTADVYPVFARILNCRYPCE